VARLALVAALVLVVTACSSSKHTTSTTVTTAGPTKSPIVVKTPAPTTQWRSPITVKGRSTLSGKLTVEVLDTSGKELGSKDARVADGRFSTEVPFAVKQLVQGAVLVRDRDRSHSAQVAVVLSP
jgi:hypothetical protein